MKMLIEEMCKNNLEYLFLSQFISSDTIHSVGDANRSLEVIKEIENDLPNANITEEKKSEFRKFLKEGKELIEKEWNINK